jgi:hypothetical protein
VMMVALDRDPACTSLASSVSETANDSAAAIRLSNTSLETSRISSWGSWADTRIGGDREEGDGGDRLVNVLTGEQLPAARDKDRTGDDCAHELVAPDEQRDTLWCDGVPRCCGTQLNPLFFANASRGWTAVLGLSDAGCAPSFCQSLMVPSTERWRE